MTEPNPIFARQESLGLKLPRAVAVVGCGGVGSWTALFLALAGVPKLFLFDHDTISESNLNRLPATSAAIAKLKSEALAAEILRYRPQCDVRPLTSFTPSTADALGLAADIDWLVCTTDTLSSRQSAYKWCQKQRVKETELFPNSPTAIEGVDRQKVSYIEAAAEGDFGSATGSPAEWSSDLERKPGYESVPVWVGPCVQAAALACSHILHNAAMPYVARVGFDGKRLSYLTAED